MSDLEIEVTSTIGGLVAERPGLGRFLEGKQVDYCCGGKKTIEDVCRGRGWDALEFVSELQEAASQCREIETVDVATMSLTELADHIERTHHAYLKMELPRLLAITEKVANAHGDHDSRLVKLRDIFLQFSRELTMHMMKEEQVLFPFIRQLEASDTLPSFHCGSLGNPIRQMEHEHHDAGAALEQFRTLTDGYTPPAEACNTYRVMLDSLAVLERDMHLHVHREDYVLFPRALQRERELESVIAS